VLQIARDAHVGDRHESQPWIAEAALDALRDDLANPIGHLRRAIALSRHLNPLSSNW
jgi:hypothetical protein